MRILVDKMPEWPWDCRYAEDLGQRYPTCRLSPIGCYDTTKCPTFQSFDNFLHERIENDKRAMGQ